MTRTPSDSVSQCTIKVAAKAEFEQAGWKVFDRSAEASTVLESLRSDLVVHGVILETRIEYKHNFIMYRFRTCSRRSRHNQSDPVANDAT